MTALGQRDLPGRRVGVLPVEEGGVPDRAHARAPALFGNRGAPSRALGALRAQETKLHEFPGADHPMEFGEKGRGKAAFSDLQGRREELSVTPKECLLRSGERGFLHGPHRLHG